MNIARNIPILVAFLRLSTTGTRCNWNKNDVIYSKTISRKVNVNKAIQASGFKNTSI
jgi:hypothetical protein